MKDTIITVFRNIQDTSVPHFIPLHKEVDRLRRGAKETVKKIDLIRKGEKNVKLQLPSVLFSGRFSYRSADHLDAHSGLMVLDWDNVPDDHYLDLKNEITTIPHVVLAFRSPSGNGIKAVIRVSDQLDKHSHPQVFTAFEEEFGFNLDQSGKDVSRVCFESYDPDLYVNYEATQYDPEIVDKGEEYVQRPAILPVTNEDQIIDRILGWNWQTSFVDGSRNQYVFNLAGAFCEFGVNQSAAENTILASINTSRDFTEKEAIAAIRSAYKKREFDSRYFEDYSRIERIKKDMRLPKREVIKNHRIDESTYEAIKEENDYQDFWDISDKGRVILSNLRFKRWLEQSGFKKYYRGETSDPVFLKVESNIVNTTTPSRMKDFVLDYLMKRGEFKVWEYISKYPNLFSEKYLNMLESINLFLMRDTKDTCFIAFENGILEVKKDSAELTDYISSDAYVWRSHIRQREWKKRSENENDYKTFIHRISGGEPLPFECAIGYMLCSYKRRTENKAIILNDENIGANAEGGTGKGIMVQGVAQLRETAIIDGKAFQSRSQFALQTVSVDTLILCFDDVAKNFNFENILFSAITEGLTLEKKNQDAIKLEVEDSPKIIITTNYTIPGEGSSHDRRRHELELTAHYKPEYTPKDEFKRELFKDWNKDDFERFDNYMVYCIQQYLKHGLVKQEGRNLKIKKFIRSTNEDFYNWAIDSIQLNQRVGTSELFESFTDDYPDWGLKGKYRISRKQFKIWVEKYANFVEAEFVSGNTNGQRWVMLKTEEETTDDIPF